MLKFGMVERFPVPPRELIERTMYRFDEYVKFAPNVTRVDVLSREKLPDGREKIVARVFARGWLPPAARSWFKQEDMNWKENYTIDFEKFEVDFNIETPMFAEYIECRGKNRLREKPGGCELVMDGEMNIGLFPIKGVPPAVVRGVINVVEPFIGKLVNLNMKNYFTNIRKVLEKEKKI